MSDLIRYLRGIFQGDSLSVLLFILAVNPLSFLLNKLKGYKMGFTSNCNTNITHLFFVDGLKLYASNLQEATKLLKFITTFSNNIRMKFGESKCAYLKIEKSLIKQSAQNLEINNVCIKPIREGESYNYLGEDENLGYVGSLNKERVTTKYKKRMQKIWSSELSAYKKHLANNTFALSVLTPISTYWIIREIQNLDRLHLPHINGGRGLKNIKTYQSRIISISQHLKLNREHNKYLRKVVAHEEDKTIRVAHELLNKHNIANENKFPKYLSKTFNEKLNENHTRDFMSKPLHGYITKTTLESQEIDKQLSLSWTTNKYITSHFESYAFAISEQEINTKDLTYRRNKAQNPTVYIDNKCKLCKTSVEDVFHILCSYPKMSSLYYLPMRHNIIAKYIFENVMKKIDPHRKIAYSDELIEVTEEK